jgi:hypothetical protein
VRWVLLWVVLLLLAAALIGWLAWGLVRKVFALGRELGRSAELVGPVLEQLPEPYSPASSVLADPSSLPVASPRPGRGRSGHRRARAGHRRFAAGDGDRASGRVG